MYKDEFYEEEITIFDPDGHPTAYIAVERENTIYLWTGEPVAYLENENIYGFNGKHLGWLEDNIVWDHEGRMAGFTREAYLKKGKTIFPRCEYAKNIKRPRPLRSTWGKEKPPAKPRKLQEYSKIHLRDLLIQGKKDTLL